MRDAPQEEVDNQCGVLSGTLDVTDTKCSDFGRDHVCCRKPNFRKESCEIQNGGVIPRPDSQDWAQCGRNASGSLTFTGGDQSFEGNEFEAQPGEFPHTCVIYRFTQGARQYVGGATLIARNKILTVAHKFYKTYELFLCSLSFNFHFYVKVIKL